MPLLEVKGLAKRYKAKDGATVHAVKTVSFTLDSGQILAFLGPNGAGKTTSIKMIAGLVRPDDGDALIAGQSVRRRGRAALTHLGAVLEGSRNLYWRMTPLENCEYWGGIRGMKRKSSRQRGLELLDLCGLADKAHHTVQQLSRGMQQQVAICCALLHRPALLLLDEPTLGLDLEASDRIQALVRDLALHDQVGIVLTTHQMEVAQTLSHRVAIIRKGEVILENGTEQALAAFSGNTYGVDLTEAPSTDLRDRLEQRGATFDSPVSFRVVLESASDVYPLLDSLRPIGVLRVQRETADLATVFRHYVELDEPSKSLTGGGAE